MEDRQILDIFLPDSISDQVRAIVRYSHENCDDGVLVILEVEGHDIYLRPTRVGSRMIGEVIIVGAITFTALWKNSDPFLLNIQENSRIIYNRLNKNK